MAMHGLEADGVSLQIYHHLFKKNKSFTSCPDLHLPDTVLFEHNFPRAWFTYDSKHNDLTKKVGKQLDTASIYQMFCKGDSSIDVIAQFTSSTADPSTGEAVTTVEFMTKDDLFVFLNMRRDKPDGVLQKFVAPKTEKNHQLQAIWSPRLTMVQRRGNKHLVSDKLLPLYDRCVTFEGPSHYSQEGHCAKQTKERVKQICNSVVTHFYSVDHIILTRMVLYFKIDKNDTIWFLWANSLRVTENRFDLTSKRVPINLSHKFLDPNDTHHEGKKSDLDVEGLLTEVDEWHEDLGKLYPFSKEINYQLPGISDRPASRRKTLSRASRAESPMSHKSDSPCGVPASAAELPSLKSTPPPKEFPRDTIIALALLEDMVYTLYSSGLSDRVEKQLTLYSADAGVLTYISMSELTALLAHVGFQLAAEGTSWVCPRKNAKPLRQVLQILRQKFCERYAAVNTEDEPSTFEESIKRALIRINESTRVTQVGYNST